jgi:hypothetical protein
MEAQLLQKTKRLLAEEVVAYLGGIQAQDYAGAQWSIGIRLSDAKKDDIERATTEEKIIRTWAYRGTLHFLAAADVSWILGLLAPVLIAANQRRYRQLELNETTFSKSHRLIRGILERRGEPLARSEICAQLEQNDISTQGQRVHYLLQRAALEGLICLGPNRGRESTYRLLSTEGDSSPAVEVSRAPTALVQRYFSSHGPATIQDFCWWTGLPTAVAREALHNVTFLQQIVSGGKELWAGRNQLQGATASALLLPSFDEYLLGYRDRSTALDPAFRKKVNAGGGMMKPVIVLNGKVVGIWKQSKRQDRIQIFVTPFRDLREGEYRAIKQAAERYSRFLKTKVELSDGRG